MLKYGNISKHITMLPDISTEYLNLFSTESVICSLPQFTIVNFETKLILNLTEVGNGDVIGCRTILINTPKFELIVIFNEGF